MSIRTKLAALIGMLLLVTAGISIICGDGLYALSRSFSNLADTKMPIQNLIGSISAKFTQFRVDEASHILSTGPEDMNAREQDMASLQKDIREELAQIKVLLPSGSERDKIDAFEGLFGQYLQTNKRLLPVSRQYDSHEHDAFLDMATDIYNMESAPVFKQASALLAEVAGSALAEVRAKTDETAASTRSKLTLVMGLVALALAIGIGAVVFANLVIAKPIRGIAAVLLKLAQGDKTVVVPYMTRRDEVGDNARAAHSFKESLTRMEQIEAERKAAEQAATADREAALARMADEFQGAVGGIVKAAVAGDFSGRVALQDKSGLILNVGRSINELCDNVEGALEDLLRMLAALADGDLTRRIRAEYQGKFAALMGNANSTAERIGRTIDEIKRSAREVSSASAEISTSTTDLSQRTEEQAASLEETSASMEQISITVRKNAENASNANRSAGRAREVADSGGQVVARAVGAMAEIEGSSHKIRDIIGVIDEIARQTNLLALNAAVEAARAGDAGRGFAVVASEVRSLAQRSAQAAKDIKDLITNSNNQVQTGVELVNQAGAALAEIVESIKDVASIVADIATASTEQATGLEQINKALSQMDEVTQQNSALVEENAATAKTLEDQAATMDERMAFFRIEGSAEAPSHPVPASAPTSSFKPSARSPLKVLPRAGKAAAARARTSGAAALKSEEEEF